MPPEPPCFWGEQFELSGGAARRDPSRSAPPVPRGRGLTAKLGKLTDLRPRQNLEVRTQQDDMPRLVVRSQHQHLRDEGPDLLGHKINYGHHPTADEVTRRVAVGDLRARALHAQRSEIDPELESGS